MQIDNIEIKLRITDAEKARAAVVAIADGPAEVLEQTDTYFGTGEGAYLKLREENGRASLIAYRRELGDDPRPSDIRLTRLDGATDLGETLRHALGVLVVVDKIRELYFRGQTRIHLDRVERLGAFLELEVVLEPGQREQDGLKIARDLVERLNLDDAEAQTDSYRDLLIHAARRPPPDAPASD